MATYFECIAVEVLVEDLRQLAGIPDGVVDRISAFLNDCQRHRIWGLPQGPEASRILGDYYLLPADAALNRYSPRLRFVRYMDDVKIFGNEEHLIRRALHDLVVVLRQRRLTWSTQKTRLLIGEEEILKEFEDGTKDAIEYGIRAGRSDTTAALRTMFDAAIQARPRIARDIRFSVYRLARLRDDHALSWVLDHMHEVPYLAPLMVEYLGAFPNRAEEIQDRVAEYLADDTRNLYPALELHLVRLLSRQSQITEPAHVVLLQLLHDSNTHHLVRAHVARCVGRHARPGDVATLDGLFRMASDLEWRRALVIAMHEGAQSNSRIGQILRGHADLSALCRYLRSTPPADLPAP